METNKGDRTVQPIESLYSNREGSRGVQGRTFCILSLCRLVLEERKDFRAAIKLFTMV